MNSNIKFVFGLAIGAACGVGATYIFCKKKYDNKFQVELQKEIETLRKLYSDKDDNKKNESDEEETNGDILDSQSFTDDDCDKVFDELDKKMLEENSINTIKFKRNPKNYKNYKNIVDGEDYDTVESAPLPVRKHWEDLEATPYIFDPNDGYIPEDYEDYEHICVFYDPSDHDACVTELGEELEDVNAKIGYDNLDILQEMINECPNEKLRNDPPVIFVRNERMGVEYEVTFDNGKY